MREVMLKVGPTICRWSCWQCERWNRTVMRGAGTGSCIYCDFPDRPRSMHFDQIQKTVDKDKVNV